MVSSVDVTVSRGGTSVDIPVLDNSSGTPLVSKDVGDPNLNIQESGSLQPRHIDQWSGLEQYTIFGRLDGGSAYSDANTLADLIKSNSDGTPLDLNIPLNDFDDTIKVAPAAGQDQSVALSYPPANRQRVDVDLALTRVAPDLVEGYTQSASTPTDGGSGPIKITDGSTSVNLETDVEVQRTIGRPNSTIRRTPEQFPRLTDNHKRAADRFEISLEFTSSAVSNINDLVALFSQQLGRDSLTLDFQGEFGLGAFNVVPDGSQALRHTRPSAQEAVNLVPTINLVRVR